MNWQPLTPISVTLLELLPHFHLYSFAVNCLLFLSDFVCHLSGRVKPILGLAIGRQRSNWRGKVLWGGPGMPAITCCLKTCFQSIFAHGGKVGRRRRRQVAINVGSLSTQGLFRPLPTIRRLIGKHLLHTWMGSSHEVEPCQRQQTFLLSRFHYRCSTLSH